MNDAPAFRRPSSPNELTQDLLSHDGVHNSECARKKLLHCFARRTADECINSSISPSSDKDSSRPPRRHVRLSRSRGPQHAVPEKSADVIPPVKLAGSQKDDLLHLTPSSSLRPTSAYTRPLFSFSPTSSSTNSRGRMKSVGCASDKQIDAMCRDAGSGGASGRYETPCCWAREACAAHHFHVL